MRGLATSARIKRGNMLNISKMLIHIKYKFQPNIVKVQLKNWREWVIVSAGEIILMKVGCS